MLDIDVVAMPLTCIHMWLVIYLPFSGLCENVLLFELGWYERVLTNLYQAHRAFGY